MEISIKKLCKNLEAILSIDKGVKVTYFNGQKPSGYYVPHIVTTKMALSGAADKVEMAWYSEIFIDGVCVFRSSYHPHDGNWSLAESRANNQLIQDIFCHGVVYAKKVLEEFKTVKNV